MIFFLFLLLLSEHTSGFSPAIVITIVIIIIIIAIAIIIMRMAGAGQMAGSLVKGWLSRGVLKPSQVIIIMIKRLSDLVAGI